MSKLYIGILLLFYSASTFGLSVEEAYRSIPHAQTTYMASKSLLQSKLKNDLENLFKIVDDAIVSRYEAYRNLFHGKSAERAIASYKLVIKEISRLQVEKEVIPVKNKILSAMKIQIEYLERWGKSQKDKKVAFNPQDPDVQKSSSDLKQAYNQLMSLYSNESGHNKKAFFDHLCALDFI